MRRALVAMTCVAGLGLALAPRAPAQDAPPSADRLASSVDATYGQIHSLEQPFYLTQFSRVTGRLSRSWGTLHVKKPGRLRLDFAVDASSASSGEMVLLDGRRFTRYAPGVAGEPGTVHSVDAQDASLTAALGFLLGRGRISESYVVRSVPPPADFRPRLGTPYALLLTPRVPGPQASVILCIAYQPGRAAVQRVTLVSHDRSRTRYDFTGQPKVNEPVPDDLFRFTPPDGTQQLTH